MDAIDILGSILGGGKSGGGDGGGLGTTILRDILGEGRKPTRSGRSSSGGQWGSQQPSDIEQEASELEDLLGVANDRSSGGTTQRSSGFPDFTTTSGTDRRPRFDPRPTESYDYRADTKRQNEDAVVLIRAMLSAAKSDGRVTRDEQQAILSRIGDASREVQNFIRAELDRPIDAKELAWSVPLGMEQKVYAISVAAIDLDSNPEAEYLRDLAHGLRLQPDVCNQIHQRFGAPTLY